MNLFPVILFHLALVFGFGFGLIVFFQLGWLGFHQIMHWLAATPSQKNPAGGEAGAVCSLLGIPTSGGDLVAIAANASPMKSAYDLAKYVYGNFGAPLAYVTSVYGRSLGRAWFFVGIPVFLLDVFVAPDYLPPWVEGMGFTQWSFAGALLSGYLLSYWMGCALPAPQKRFNRARLLYEREVASHGYWFDSFLSGRFFYSRQVLQRAEAIFQQLRNVLSIAPISSSLLLQRKMALEYQSALLLASMESYDEAIRAVRAAAEWREELKESDIWESGEYDITKSQMLFLEGELLYLEGDMDAAKDRFSASLAIDKRNDDTAGVEVIEKRLALLKHGRAQNYQQSHRDDARQRA